jgi:hypothetical protein
MGQAARKGLIWPRVLMILDVHIPKTEGTAPVEAFRHAYGDRLRVYPIRYESQYGPIAGIQACSGQ